MILVHGIKNCDSVKKAARFFKAHGIPFKICDFRDTPADCAQIDRWLETAGVDTLLNRRSKAYRAIPQNEKPQTDKEIRNALCRDNLLIKRPVIEKDDETVTVGFDKTLYKELFL